MKSLNVWLISAAVAGATYLLTGLAVLVGRTCYDRKRAIVDRLGQILGEQAGSLQMTQQQRARADDYLSSISRRRLKRLFADTVFAAEVNDVICRHLVDRIGVERLQREALSRAKSSSPWPRITALQILAFGRIEAAWTPLEKALVASDSRVAGAAVTILGNLPDHRAAELLAKALRVGCYSASRISTFLDDFPLDLSALVGSLLSQPSANVRYWGAIMLRRYPGFEGADRVLVSLTHDKSPLVRRAAIESLSLVGGDLAAGEARRLLSDEVSYVRAYAARALGNLGLVEAAPAVGSLLADREWWVRYAAKVSLEAMGTQAIPHILPLLKHEDRFARNGAAEVLQNLEYFEQLLAEELLEPSQPDRLEILEQLGRAGGMRMSEAMINRLPLEARPNASSLLASLGMERNGGQP